MDELAIAVGITATVCAVGGIVYVVSRDPTIQFRGVSPPTTLLGRPMNNDEIVRAILALPPPRYFKWRRFPKPVGARAIPIVTNRLITTPVPTVGDNLTRSSANFQNLLTVYRTGLASAGRGDEDAKCVLWLHLKETGWFAGRRVPGVPHVRPNGCYGWNLGNRKLQPYLDPAEVLRSGTVYVVNPSIQSAFTLKDGLRSVDFYSTFSDFAAGLRGEKEWLLANHYDGVIAGYRRGGWEGLKAACVTLGTRRYSGKGTAVEIEQRIDEAKFYWNRFGVRLAPNSFQRAV